MDLILTSPNTQNELQTYYDNALKNAKELYIASAYFTSWTTKTPLNAMCEKIVFLVGTDFGLTRKNACSSVLKWIPKKFTGCIYAVPRMIGNFHPKIIAWKDSQGKAFAIIGSSNLTEAAFGNNYEANIKVSLPINEYEKLIKWIEIIAAESVPMDNDWINQYKETKQKPFSKTKKFKESEIEIPIPTTAKYQLAITNRREAESTFKKIEKDLDTIVRNCAKGKISNSEFWSKFWETWSGHSSRIQGSGIQFLGKGANWKIACLALLEIIDLKDKKDLFQLDTLTKTQINKLHKLKHPMRGAWFTEMLCHFIPEHYPVMNNPVKIYFRENKWNPQRGLSEGEKYLSYTKKMRVAIKVAEKHGPKNMPELDAVIFEWCKQRNLLNKLEYGRH